MRIVVAANFLLAASAVLFSCASFGGDASSPPGDDAAAPDGGGDDSVKMPDAGCDALLCDDFERPSVDLTQGWQTIEGDATHATIEPAPGAGHGSALHIHAPDARDGQEAALRKDVRVAGMKLMTLDYEYFQPTSSDANLVSLSIRDAREAGQVFVVVTKGPNFSVGLQTIAAPKNDYGAVGVQGRPGPGEWHHVTLTVDLASKVVDARVDGTALSSTAKMPNLTALNHDHVIVNLGVTYTFGSTKPFDVWFDDVRIALTP